MCKRKRESLFLRTELGFGGGGLPSRVSEKETLMFMCKRAVSG